MVFGEGVLGIGVQRQGHVPQDVGPVGDLPADAGVHGFGCAGHGASRQRTGLLNGPGSTERVRDTAVRGGPCIDPSKVVPKVLEATGERLPSGRACIRLRATVPIDQP
ncbi:hypothetical protein SY2F82_74690 [Streptomyces sp. Y2F8-2]|nr:hypothetical protein SY2F82_74690 [Streptomyces sp. Y2F8-2]